MRMRVALGSEDAGGNARFVSFEASRTYPRGWRKPERFESASGEREEHPGEVTVVLDTGADVSVLPLSFKGVGR